MDNLKKIIRKCLRGSIVAQNELYSAYKNSWYKCSLRYSRSKDEAQDILQEGLIHIFRDLGQFAETKSQFSTWSNRVLVHAALRYIKKSRWQDSFTDIGDEVNENSEPEIMTSYLSEQELIGLITKLPTGYRLVFNMYVLEGYRHDEIARYLDISVGTSKSQLHKAKKILKKEVESILLSN